MTDNRFTVFDAPGPGAWELETTHMSRPMSRWMASIMPQAATTGFQAGTARYGLLLECMEFKVVNGFMYTCARGVGAPKGAKGPPPKFIFKLLLLLHPELRRRLRVADDLFEKKSWRQELEVWDREEKPAVARENEALQKVDARALSNEALIAHLETCRDLVDRAITRHHRLNPVAMIPLGDFLAHVHSWTSLHPSAILPLLCGASAVSRGAEAELRQVVVELEGRDDLKPRLTDPDGRGVLALLSGDARAGAAVRNYVDAVGIRVTSGYDVADVSMEEMPELIVDTIRAAVERGNFVTIDTLAADTDRVRNLVPSQFRVRFDELLTEARDTYRMRDERGYLNDAWSIGIARRALLAAGERLAADGRLESAQHVFELEPSELSSVLRGGPSPAPDFIADWHRHRTTRTVADAPPNLGPLPSGPPPADWLPPNAARLQRAIDVVLMEMFARHEDSAAGSTISGIAASPGDVTGRARLVLKPDDMARVQSGEVLITRATGPSYNALLPLIRGVVTDRGGTLSHAAVVAREYGIPAVVGCGNATELIPDGVMVRVDGTTGTVHLVS